MVLIVLNSFAYILTFLYFTKKNTSLQIGHVVLLFYSIVSIGSVYLYSEHPVWGVFSFTNLTFIPFLYLYIILFLSFKPLMVYNNNKVRGMQMPTSFLMDSLSIVIILVYFAYFLQTILTSFSIYELLDANILAENHEDGGARMIQKGVVNIFGVLKNIFVDILWVMFMYNWLFGKKILALGLIASIIISILSSLAWGARGSLFTIIMQMPFAFITFIPLMSTKQKRLLSIVSGITALFILTVFGLMTYGRFGDNSTHTAGDVLVYYLSSDFLMFNNYAFDPGDCRYGDRVFPLIRALLGLETAEGFLERRAHYPHLRIDDSQFTFFVGEFCIDFGPILAFVIIAFFAFVFYNIFKKKKYDMGDIVLGVFWYQIIINGFSLFAYAEKSGNMRILYVLFFAFLFKQNTPKVSRLSQSTTKKNELTK